MIEQSRLNGRPSSRQGRRQNRAIEIGAKRFRAEAGEQVVRLELVFRNECHQPEAAVIVETYFQIIADLDHDMLMRSRLPLGRAIGEDQAPRHPEVNHEDLPVIEPKEQIFGTTIDRLDPPAHEPVRKIQRKWNAQVRAADLNLPNRPPDNTGGKAAADGLNFWEFRHGPGNLACHKALRYGPPMANNTYEKRSVGQADFGFEQVPESEKSNLVRAVFEGVAGRYDLMNDLMSAGVHRLWKAALVDALAPQPGMRLLDIAGGTGDIAFRVHARLAHRPGGGDSAEIVVSDINREMIEVGRGRAIDRGLLGGISWICADAEALPLADMSVDACTVAFGLRNMTHLDRALSEARRVLRPGGRFLCLEFSHVTVPVLDQLYDRYSFAVLPALGRFVTGQEDAYRYLVESIRRFPRQEELAGLITAAGFDRVGFRNLSGGIAALHGAWRL